MTSAKKLREKYFTKDGKPRCASCGEGMEKIEEQSSKYHSTWKLNCNCIKEFPKLKGLRLSIG